MPGIRQPEYQFVSQREEYPHVCDDYGHRECRLPYHLLGEITPTMAAAVASNDAKLILIPMSKCHATIVGVESRRLGEYIAEAVDEIAENCF